MPPEAKKCSACGQDFSCGSKQAACWCQKLPPLPAAAVKPTADCLCLACLRSEVFAVPVLFGIANCDTMKKCQLALKNHGIVYCFWDYKKFGVPEDLLGSWLATKGVETLINQRGPTWRKLPAETQAAAKTATDALAVLVQNSSAIKRPLLLLPDKNKTLLVGLPQILAHIGD